MTLYVYTYLELLGGFLTVKHHCDPIFSVLVNESAGLCMAFYGVSWY